MFKSVVLTLSIFVCIGAISQAPVINSFSPNTGSVGTIVTVNGTNFSTVPASNIVYFGNVRATVLTAADNTLTVSVPYGSFCSPISVANPAGLSGWSRRNFITTYTNNAYGFSATSFKPKVDYSVAGGFFYQEIAVADFNNDGKPDLVTLNTSSNRVSVFKNITSSDSIQFAPKVDYNGSSLLQAISIGDFDTDGKLDFVVSNGSAKNLSFYRNISTDSTVLFQNYFDINTGLNPGRSAVADFDGDGKLDIAFVNGGAANVFSVMRNLSTPGVFSFAPRNDFATGNSPLDISSADFNEDNKADIVVVNQNSNTVSVFINKSTVGSTSFNPKIDLPTGRQPRAVVTGDIIGNDGKPDIVVTNYDDSTVSIIANYTYNGNLYFTPKADIGTFGGIRHATINDFDGDGLIDICTANTNRSTVSIIKNASSSAISFLPKVDFKTGADLFFVVSADLNMDGKPDILTANTTGKSISVLQSRAGSDAPFLTSFKPVFASVGTPISIKGKNLTNVSSIKFGGTPALSLTVINDSTIAASIAAGASGAVTVASNEGQAKLKGFVFAADPVEDRQISTIAGNGMDGYNGDSSTAANASFKTLLILHIDTARGYLYINDAENFRIRRLDINTGTIITVAGNGSGGGSGNGGPATAAQIFSYSTSLITDKSGNLYFGDMGFQVIRKVNVSTGIISRIAGGGNGDANIDGVNPLSVYLTTPTAFSFTSNGDLYFSDEFRLRKIDAISGLLKNISANYNTGSLLDSIDIASARVSNVSGMAIDKNGNIYLVDQDMYKIRKIDAFTGKINTIAGNGVQGTDGDGGQAKLAELVFPSQISLDTSGKKLYITESPSNVGLNRIRMIDLNTGIINTVAGGNLIPAHFGDGGSALTAGLNKPKGVAIGKNNELYVSESNYIRLLNNESSFVNLCGGGSASLKSSSTGSDYHWEINTGTGFENAADNSNISGVNSALLQLNNIPASWSGYIFRCLVDSKAANSFTLKFENLWTGAVDSSWENISNWSCNSLPDANTNVVINTGTIVVNSNAACRSLSIKPTAQVIVTPTFQLIVAH